MKEEPHNPFSDQELEARIVALVLGEASDFERDELNRLIEQRPELAAFKDQIESVHGLLRHVETSESPPADDDWKLPADKRSAVLAVIGEDAEKQSAQRMLNQLAEERRSFKGRSFLRIVTGIAAVISFIAISGSLAIVPFLNRRAAETLSSRPQTLPQAHYLMDEEVSASDEWYSRTAEPSTSAEVDSKKNSKSALSAIRDSLDADSIAAMPNDDEGRSVTISLDPGGPPTADLDFRFGTRVLNGQTSSGGFTAGATATEAAKGPEPSATADNSARTAKQKTEWSDDFDGDGQRLAEQQRARREAGSGELSFPKFASEGDFGASDQVHSTIRVPEGGTVLLGGVKRLTARPGEPEAFGEPADSSTSTREYFESAGQSQRGGGGEQGAAALGLDDRRLWRQAENSNSLAVDRTNRIGDEQRQSQSALDDTLDAAEGIHLDGYAADGNLGGGGGGFGGFGGGGLSVESGYENFRPKYEPQEKAQSGVRRVTRDAKESAPSQPLAAGKGDRPEMDAGVVYDTRVPPSPQLAKPVRSAKPTASSENFTSGGKLTITEGNEERVREKNGTRLSDDDITTSNRRDLDLSLSRPPSKPVTGAATVALRGELESGEAQQRIVDVLSDYETDLHEFRDHSELDGEQGGLRPGRGQSAVAGESLLSDYVSPTLDKSRSIEKAPAKKVSAPAGLNEKDAESEAFSTFSLHVSDVSFKLARAALARGEWPDAAKVRIEEFVNALDYGDPMPNQNERVACCLEQSIHPFLQQRNLLRVSMRTAAAGRSSSTPLRLTLLLDNSGSMERIDRQQTVRRAFALLAQQLKPIDQVTLISFARQPRLLADKVSGGQSHQLVQLIDSLPSEGGTNIETALQLAFEKAQEQQLDGAQNRIILLTDGAVNLGDANPDSLSQMITTMRNAGIAFDAAGISAEGLNDEILEALTRKGDGRYYLLDSLEAADDGFARQIAGALRPSAKNVKVQIEFNPKRVGRYKLLGFEKHRLKQEDFRNDKVDAAEMAAAEAGVAVYQFEAKPNGEGDVGSVSVRFRDLSTGRMIENCWPIPYEADAPRPDQSAPSLRIATSAALLAAKLRGEPLGETVSLRTLSDLIAGLPDLDRNASRVQQLHLMIQQARQMSGE